MKRSRLQPCSILNPTLIMALAVTATVTMRSEPQITATQLASLTPVALTNCLSPGNYYFLHGPDPEQPWPPLPAAPLDVPELIKDAVMAVSTLFREREQSIRLELADNLPKLHTDREGLQQILQHLFSNAALCSPNQAEVVVRAQVPLEMADYLLFSVTDQGGGIALEDRQRAFHRMYRADHPLVEGLGETGVGLSIAKALVEAQGGRIWVDSDMGVGSTFTFILPLEMVRQEVQA